MHAVNELIMLYNELDNDDFYKNAIAQVLKNLEAVPTASTYEELEWDSQFLSRGIDYVADTFQNVREDVSDTDIIRAARALHGAQHIAFFTGPGSPFLRNLQMRLTLSGKDVHVVKNQKDRDEFISHMKPKSLICVIEMVYTKHEAMFVQLKSAGATVIYIANRCLESPPSNVDLYIGFHGSSFRRDGLGIETILAGISLAFTNCSLA